MTEPDWQNSVILAGDPVDEVGRLKAMDGADIVLTGSITLAHLLIAEGLVDEFRMFGYPAVQGAGGGSSRWLLGRPDVGACSHVRQRRHPHVLPAELSDYFLRVSRKMPMPNGTRLINRVPNR